MGLRPIRRDGACVQRKDTKLILKEYVNPVQCLAAPPAQAAVVCSVERQCCWRGVSAFVAGPARNQMEKAVAQPVR